jgi:hypothetical protein
MCGTRSSANFSRSSISRNALNQFETSCQYLLISPLVRSSTSSPRSESCHQISGSFHQILDTHHNDLGIFWIVGVLTATIDHLYDRYREASIEGNGFILEIDGEIKPFWIEGQLRRLGKARSIQLSLAAKPLNRSCVQ